MSVRLISSRTLDGVAEAASAILRERRGRDVYILGAANVGKSAFIRWWSNLDCSKSFQPCLSPKQSINNALASSIVVTVSYGYQSFHMYMRTAAGAVPNVHQLCPFPEQ